ncbi:hypothetical protein [Turicimonas sp. TL08]
MENAKEIGRAFRLGLSFSIGQAFKRNNRIAEDASKWITVHPNGKEAKGRPALIDESTGNILGGMGGKFTGKHISKAKSDKKLNEEHEQRVKERLEKRKKLPEKLDFKNPEKISSENVLQNRDRTSVASRTQMHAIAQNPDYDRLSQSRDFGSGAPVVAFGSIPENQLGRKEWATMPDGTKYAVQYAVVDANKVLTSNDINGQTNNDYYSDDPSKIRAIAGNGRVTGLTQAYKQGTAQDYSDDLYMDNNHGVDKRVISKMDNPILVRVMQPKDVTKDIGDKSNVAGNIQMTAVEQARNDANRVSFDQIQTYQDGSPTQETLVDFVKNMPASEQGGLIDKSGKPTRQALYRFNAAVFEKAYENEGLTTMYAQALEPESKNIINALEGASAKMQALRNAGSDYDIRDLVSNAAMRAINARSKGQNLKDEATSQDLFKAGSENTAENMIIKLFADNPRSSKTITEKLNRLADDLLAESQTDSLFGEKVARNDVIKHSLSRDSIPQKLNQIALDHWKQQGGKYLSHLFTNQPKYKKFFTELRKKRETSK